MFHCYHVTTFRAPQTMSKLYIRICKVLVELFTRNYEFHNHFTRQSQSLHTAVGRNEAIYKTFTFHGIRIWNYISTKISVDVSYASFKHSSKLFIKNNPIPYRVT